MNVGRIARISTVLIIFVFVAGLSITATGDELLSPNLALSATISAAPSPPGAPEGNWRLWVKSLNLDRNDVASTLMTDSLTPGGSEILGSSDLDLGERAGREIGTAFKTPEREYEIRFYDLPAWNASTGTMTSDDGFAVQFVEPIGVTDEVFDFDAQSRSKLKGAELNARWPTKGGTVKFFAGIGKASLEDNLSIAGTVESSEPYDVAFDIAARNELWGGQVGMAAPLFTLGKLTANWYGKYGFYRNSISTRVNTDEEDGPSYSVRAGGHKFCSMRDIGFDLTYALKPDQTITVGLHDLALYGVATAARQIPFSDPVGGTAEFGTGTIKYRGLWGAYTFHW